MNSRQFESKKFCSLLHLEKGNSESIYRRTMLEDTTGDTDEVRVLCEKVCSACVAGAGHACVETRG